MTGSIAGLYRMRLSGGLRVIVDLRDDCLEVIKIGRRDKVYKKQK
jgi:mRNA-degrading endonuclease RelE of RelBE toxin-antitoxin system